MQHPIVSGTARAHPDLDLGWSPFIGVAIQTAEKATMRTITPVAAQDEYRPLTRLAPQRASRSACKEWPAREPDGMIRWVGGREAHSKHPEVFQWDTAAAIDAMDWCDAWCS